MRDSIYLDSRVELLLFGVAYAYLQRPGFSPGKIRTLVKGGILAFRHVAWEKELYDPRKLQTDSVHFVVFISAFVQELYFSHDHTKAACKAFQVCEEMEKTLVQIPQTRPS